MLSQEQISQLLDAIYTGRISVFDLPQVLYAHTRDALYTSLSAGWGALEESQILEQEKAHLFRQNINRFSGAKTWQEVNALSEAVFDPEIGAKRSFSEFKKIALQIDETYNLTWLAVEQDTCVMQAMNARKWLKFEGEKEMFPFLRYQTVGDGKVRHSHAMLDGLTRRVDDPIWDSVMPQNGYGCRCIVTQHEAGEYMPTTKIDGDDKTKPLFKEFKKNGAFNYNSGKVDFVFKENGNGKHEYFKVPREFREDLKNNFGLE